MADLCAPEGLLEKLGLQLIPPYEVIAAPNILYKADEPPIENAHVLD
jgi:hypothetical protein